MVEKEYAKAYKEVMEILRYIPEEDRAKIPKKKLEFYEANMDCTYPYKVDTSKEFEKQVMLDETKAILANLFRDYWATPYQKERIEAKEKFDLEKLEEEKRAKYNSADLFKNKKIHQKTVLAEQSLVELKKETFFQKLIRFLKKVKRK